MPDFDIGIFFFGLMRPCQQAAITTCVSMNRLKISREFVTMQALGVLYAVAVNVNSDRLFFDGCSYAFCVRCIFYIIGEDLDYFGK